MLLIFKDDSLSLTLKQKMAMMMKAKQKTDEETEAAACPEGQSQPSEEGIISKGETSKGSKVDNTIGINPEQPQLQHQNRHPSN